MSTINIDTTIIDIETIIDKESPSFNEIAGNNVCIERLATGFTFTEGPIWHPEGFLLFSDIPEDRIWQWHPDRGISVYREPSGRSNGLTLDSSNQLIACEHLNRRVSLTKSDGTIYTIADRYLGSRLNSPNDVVVSSSGSIYFTDPPCGIKEHQKELNFNGVYMYTPKGDLVLLTADFERPNGLAFSPDESILYINDSFHKHVRAFFVRSDGMLNGGEIIAELQSSEKGVPDGMKVDKDGNLFVTGPGGIWIFKSDGTHVGKIRFPEIPANCAWGDQNNKDLYVTARKSLYRLSFYR